MKDTNLYSVGYAIVLITIAIASFLTAMSLVWYAWYRNWALFTTGAGRVTFAALSVLVVAALLQLRNGSHN